MENLIGLFSPLIEKDEGCKLYPYIDSKGNITIGAGHNLTAKGISKAVKDALLLDDMKDAISECRDKIDFFDGLDTARKYVLINMTFNEGIHGVLGFVHMLSSMRSGDFKAASEHLLNSAAARELPARYQRLAYYMETGNTP